MPRNIHIANNYKTLIRNGLPIVINYANGIKLTDTNRNSYYDLTSCYSASNFGHQHPRFKKILIEQLDKISICSRFVENTSLNLLGHTVNKYFGNKIQQQAGDHLQVLPSLGGVDAFETSVKLARAWAYTQKQVPWGQARLLFARGNFSGRTITACSVSSYSYQKKFYPEVPNLDLVPYNDEAELVKYIEGNHSCLAAICLEPIQGEGGINVPNNNYLCKVRQLCDKYNVLLICDEIQTGLRRTGSLLCSESFNVKPDIVLLGKSLGAGYVPISICIASNEIMSCIKPGEHGSTFGGNPLASIVGTSVLEYLHQPEVIKMIDRLETNLTAHLIKLWKHNENIIKEIRGKGLLWGIEFYPHVSASEMTNKLVNFGIITKDTSHNTIRICPAFITTKNDLDDIFENINKCFKQLM